MNNEILYRLFLACLECKYSETEDGGSFFCRRDGEVLYLFFEKSNGLRDWENNFRFHAERYGEGGFYCHSGFLRVWRSILPYIKDAVHDPDIAAAVIVGYSHGGAIATLCHEYIWRERPDVRPHLYGYGFGAPRVVFGRAKGDSAKWASYCIVRNIDDLITHLPPRITGYRHVGRLVEVGERDTYNPIDAHREESYLRSLSPNGSSFGFQYDNIT